MAAANTLRADSNPASMEAIVQYLIDNSITFDVADVTDVLSVTLSSAQGGIAAGALEDWHEIGATSEPGFANSWVNAGAQATAAFMKLPTGLVVIKGIIKSGTLGTAAFTLPVGYRTVAQQDFAAYTSGAALGRVVLSSNGQVRPFNGANPYFSISCSFMAKA